MKLTQQQVDKLVDWNNEIIMNEIAQLQQQIADSASLWEVAKLATEIEELKKRIK